MYSEPQKHHYNSAMFEAGILMSELYPLIFDEKIFSTKDNEQKLKQNINRLQKIFTEQEQHINQEIEPFQASYEMAKEHLDVIVDSYSNGTAYGTQNLLRTLGYICSNCHAQDTKERTIFSGVERIKFDSDFQYAEFSYATRDYKTAAIYYNQFILDPKNQDEFYFNHIALKRMLTIYVQIYKDLKTISLQLKQYEQLPWLKPLKNDILGWNEGIKKLTNNQRLMVKNLTFSHIQQEIEKYFDPSLGQVEPFLASPKNEITYLWLRGTLHDYLNENPKTKHMPLILYWLSLTERALDYNYYYSFADLYLKNCMRHYPNDPVAKKCYQEYERYTEFAYSGSLIIPRNVLDELNTLHKLIYGDDRPAQSAG